MTQLEMMTSTLASGSGMLSISPLRNSTLATPAFRWFSRASASISSVMSSPYALPVGPTRLAESSTSMPPPEPRSSTTSPGLSWASAVGLPQPSEAATASAGSSAVSQQPRVLQGLEVERQARLAGVQHVGQVAHALLAAPQPLDDAEPCGIGERAKQRRRSLEVLVRRRRHGRQYIKIP